MAIASNGPDGGFRGKLGNKVYYMLNGQNVVREIGISSKPPTEAKLESQLSLTMRSKLFSILKEYINVGFGVEAKGTTKNATNLAMKYNTSAIINGIYPDLNIKYDQLILSAGVLKSPVSWSVTQVEGGIEFIWPSTPDMAWPDSSDQPMMLAYFPKKQEAFYTLFGGSRLSGKGFLEIPPSFRNQYMETYLSFVSADRTKLSPSTYTGALNNGLPEQLVLPF